MKPQVWLAVSYDTKLLYIHAKRGRKKLYRPTIKPDYRHELNGVNSTEFAYVVGKIWSNTSKYRNKNHHCRQRQKSSLQNGKKYMG